MEMCNVNYEILSTKIESESDHVSKSYTNYRKPRHMFTPREYNQQNLKYG